MGLGLDPLTLKPELLLVSIIDRYAFSAAASSYLPDGKLPDKNDEGEIVVKDGGWGEPLTQAILKRYREGVATLPAASGCLELFQLHAEKLLGFPIE